MFSTIYKIRSKKQMIIEHTKVTHQNIATRLGFGWCKKEKKR